MRRHLFTVLLLLGLLVLPTLAQSPSVRVKLPSWRYGLQHWWRAAPGLTGSAQFYNLVMPLNYGTLTNMGFSTTSGWSPTTRPGGYMQVNFDGTDDYVDTSVNAGMNFNTPFSLCAWVYATGPGGNGTGVILQTAPEDGAVQYAGIWFSWQAGRPRFLLVTDTSNQKGIRATDTLPQSVWGHVCVTYDGSAALAGMTLYSNGQVLPSTTETDFGTVTSFLDRPWRIGTDTAGSPINWFQGSLDNLMVWTRALPAADMAAVYQDTLTGQDVPNAAPSLMAFAPRGGFQGTFFPFFP